MTLTDTEIWSISIVERACSSVSTLCVLFVLLTYLFSPGFNKPINRQIFYATWSNLGLCIAGLIGVNGYANGPTAPLCRFQGFLVQMFLAVDAYWALCMAINVYLAFFSGYTVERLRRLDLRYLIISYGASAIPAFIFLFITTSNGPIYGNASVWCWISTEWDFLRLATVYVFVWIALLLSLIVYIMAGRVIYKRRSELDGFLNPWNESPFANMVVTEVIVTSEERGAEDGYLEDGTPMGMQHDSLNGDEKRRNSNHQIYSVNIEAAPQPKRPGAMQDVLNVRSVTREVAASNPNAESWLYARVAFLFFFALAFTWIPSSVNRVYGIFNPDNPSFGLNMITAFLLPLQGFWNMIVYCITSRTACERLWNTILRRPQPRCVMIENSHHSRRRPESGASSLISTREENTDVARSSFGSSRLGGKGGKWNRRERGTAGQGVW